MFRVVGLVGIALIGGALAACADAVTVRPTYIGSYDPNMLTYQAGQGAMKIEIFGAPDTECFIQAANRLPGMPREANQSLASHLRP